MPQTRPADLPRAPVADLARLHVVVPVRGGGGGKSRLGGAIDPEERLALVVGLLVHTIAVLDGWSGSTRNHVVSGDVQVRSLVRQRTAERTRPVVEQRSSGLNRALLDGRFAAIKAGATAVLYLPADLPLLDLEALDRLLAAADAAIAAGSGSPIVVLAPADARVGTNALLVSPADAIDPQFGEESLQAHLRAAAEADATVQIVDDPALGFDLDTPDDLERLDVARVVELQHLGHDALDALVALRSVDAAEAAWDDPLRAAAG